MNNQNNDDVPLRDTTLNKGVLKRLKGINITTLGQLSHLGAVNTYLKLKEHYPEQRLPKCYNFYDPAAIIMGLSGWRELTKCQKDVLLQKLERQ